MCGIVGYWGKYPSEALRRSLACLSHRGPDGEGVYLSSCVPVGLGNRRLSIIDLQTGNQPMCDHSCKIWVVFNGEIYNFKTLRAQLEAHGHRFSTKSDTEVIIYAYKEYDDEFANHLDGMFAVALLDEERQKLFLVRDRLGIKPLYYYFNEKGLIFASEVKAILQFPGVSCAPNIKELCSLLTWGYSISHETIFNDVKRVLPGEIIVYDGQRLKHRHFWQLSPSPDICRCSFEDAVAELKSQLKRAISSHLVSDVPIGAALSGGLDSSAVVSVAASEIDEQLEAFCVGYGVSDDEILFAQACASHLGVQLHVKFGDLQAMTASLGKMIWHLEEPIPHIQMATTFLLGQSFQERGIKVALIGEGSDELFAGYLRHTLIRPWLIRLLHNYHHPRALMRLLAEGEKSLSEGYFASHHGLPLSFLRQLFDPIWEKDIDAFVEHHRKHLKVYFPEQGPKSLYSVLRCELEHQLPNSQLLRVDKLLMASSIEARVPYLDHHLVEWAMHLPDKYKVTWFANKVLLRHAMRELLPSVIYQRPKAGPKGTQSLMEPWLSQGLKDAIIQLVNEQTIKRRELFRWPTIKPLIDQFRSANRNAKTLFSLALFEVWCRRFIDAKGTSNNVHEDSSFLS